MSWKAEERLAAVELVRDQVAGGLEAEQAVALVAAAADASRSTLREWTRRAAEAPNGEVLAALVDRPRTGRRPEVWLRPGAEALWRLWRRMFQRLEHPTAAGCWRTVEQVAARRGWEIPGVKEFQRRWKREASPLQAARGREGRLAALALLPFQERTVEGLRPLEWVNGDGYKHNLWVVPPDGGAPVRPRTWAWQDVRTRRILAWRSGLTESSDLVRMALYDLVEQCGVPLHVLVDNTMAAAAKWLGANTLRWRADRDDDVQSIVRHLGMTPHNTGVDRTDAGKGRGRGRAKPVERAFRDWGDAIDKHPRAAGAWTGANALAKPENYGGRALPWETFVAVVADGVREMNARPGRRTEAAAGRSFDETWEAEIATAPVRRLTQAQMALLLAAAESTRVDNSGCFRLRAGKGAGLPPNRYHHEKLAEHVGRRVVARFDPHDLHGAAEVFDGKGHWLCRAGCVAAVGFGDTEAAREWARARAAKMRDVDRAHRSQEHLDDLLDRHGVNLQPAPAPGRPKVVRMQPAADETRPDAARRRALQEKLDRGLAAVQKGQIPNVG